jgi:hypothetical protein
MERPEQKPLRQGEYLTYKLRNVPNDPNSPTYELSVPLFKSGSPEEFILFRRNLNKVLTGQNVNDGPGKFVVARRLLQGDALAAFNNELGGDPKDDNSFNRCMDAVRDWVFPPRALLLQKRAMRRYMRKPKEFLTRKYIAHMNELNSYLLEFPPVVAGQAPTALADDEMADLLEFGIPFAWQAEMLRQDFDPLGRTNAEFLRFCERMETVEGHTDGPRSDDTRNVGSNNNNNKRKRKNGERNNDRDEDNNQHGRWCMVHGKGRHDTEHCEALKGAVKRLKTDYEDKKENKSSTKSTKKYVTKEEVHAMLARAQKNPKRKAESQDDTEDELANFENLSVSSDSSKE